MRSIEFRLTCELRLRVRVSARSSSSCKPEAFPLLYCTGTKTGTGSNSRKLKSSSSMPDSCATLHPVLPRLTTLYHPIPSHGMPCYPPPLARPSAYMQVNNSTCIWRIRCGRKYDDSRAEDGQLAVGCRVLGLLVFSQQ